MEDRSTVEAATTSTPGRASFPSLSEKKLISSKDLDETYNTYKLQDARDTDPQEARQVLRKIDRHLLPLLMGTYLLQYLDKSSINFASVFGLKQGTHLHGQQYSWLSSLFYIGYLLAQPVAGYLLQRLPIGKFIGSTAVGMCLIATNTREAFLTTTDVDPGKSGVCSPSRLLLVPTLLE
jgi:hypothetical protein